MRTQSAASSRPSTSGKGRRSKVIAPVRGNDTTSILSTTPVNFPPSLKDRSSTDADLFQYYSVRGFMEVFQNESALRACLGEVSAEEREAAAAGLLASTAAATCDSGHPCAANPLANENASAPLGSPKPTNPVSAAPLRGAVVADSSQPLFPRLRGTKSEDDHSIYLRAQCTEAHRAEQLERQKAIALPPSQAHYAHLFRPHTDYVDEMIAVLKRTAADALKDTSAKSAHLVGHGRASVLPSRRYSDPETGKAGDTVSPRRPPLPSCGGGVRDGEAAISPGVATAFTSTSAKNPYTAAALRQESRDLLAKEVEDIFVASYDIRHPDAAAKRRAAEELEKQRRVSRVAGSLLVADTKQRSARNKLNGQATKSSKRKEKRKSAPKPPPDGAPGPNLRFFLTCLLSICDEQGVVCLSQFQQMMTDVPFEVTHQGALADFFSMVRAVSDVKLREAADMLASTTGWAPGASSALSDSAWGAGGSRSSVAQRPSLQESMSRVLGNTVLRSQVGNSHILGTSAHVSPRSVAPSSSGARQSLHDATKGCCPHNGNAPPAGDPSVFMWELLSAIDALLNGSETHAVVRWICFNVLAEEGNGYIHKATLATIRKLRREECERLHGELTPSIVKALNDCFDALALEEEAAYVNATRKGKRKKKGPQLAEHQKSAIPLHVMRCSHMTYPMFCRFFDELPQVAAAFSHVWMAMLLTGKVVAELTEDEDANGVGTIQTLVPHNDFIKPVPSTSIRIPTLDSGKVAPRSDRSGAMGSTGTAGEMPADESHATLLPSEGRAVIVADTPTEKPLQEPSSKKRNVMLFSETFLLPLEPEMPSAEKSGTYPLSILGDSCTRRSTVQRIVVDCIECAKRGKEQLQVSREQKAEVTEGKSVAPGISETSPAF